MEQPLNLTITLIRTYTKSRSKSPPPTDVTGLKLKNKDNNNVCSLPFVELFFFFSSPKDGFCVAVGSGG